MNTRTRNPLPPPSGVPHASLLAVAVVAASVLAGCGYSTQETFPAQYATVALPIFENRTFYKGVEYDLAEALNKQIESRTPYKTVRPGAADTILEGTITDIKQRRVSRASGTALPEIMELRITVDYQWKDLRSGEVILDRRGFEAVGQYIPAREVGEPRATAEHDAVARLATDIVDTLRGGW